MSKGKVWVETLNARIGLCRCYTNGGVNGILGESWCMNGSRPLLTDRVIKNR